MEQYSESGASHTCLASMPEEFKDIAPYGEEEFHEVMKKLVAEDGFRNAVQYCMPDVDYQQFAQMLLGLRSQSQFQHQVMGSFLEKLISKTTAGLTCSGLENLTDGRSYTFISNHRDIVLDASLLNVCFMRSHKPLTQIAIGNNLLIYDWIADLVKVNRSFIVKRDVRSIKALEAAKQLSAYIHYTITKLNESIWIAQRQGRAKDSNDLTQESLIKMLALGCDNSVKESLLEVSLTPVSISYEYDPNDYLKATEFLKKRRDPEFKKTNHDDLLSMETGMLSNKGRVHFHIGKCINDDLEKFPEEGRNEVVRECCRLIDRSIHSGYMIYPGNYIAYDMLSSAPRFADKYTPEQKEAFLEYVEKQLDKVRLTDIKPEERDFMRQTIFGMYANPLYNRLQALKD